MKEENNLLEGLPPAKKLKKRARRKFVPTRGIPAEVSVRRQVAEEIGDAEPTRDQKYILLQKYGAVVTVVDRRVTKPNWMSISTWKRKLNEWFAITKGVVKPQQRKQWQNKTQRTSNDTIGRTRKPFAKEWPRGKESTRRNSGATR